MYVHLGGNVIVRTEDVLGIFDLDNTSTSHITRSFLKKAENNGKLINIAEDLPRSFVLCSEGREKDTIFFSQLNSATLIKRTESFSNEKLTEEIPWQNQ